MTVVSTPRAENCENREDTVQNRPITVFSYLFLSKGYEHCQQHTRELHSAESCQALLVLRRQKHGEERGLQRPSCRGCILAFQLLTRVSTALQEKGLSLAF